MGSRRQTHDRFPAPPPALCADKGLLSDHNTAAVRTPQRRSAFTLIELLAVLAIVAILAAVAVPNFLEAQTRSKLSRVQADMRTILLGLVCYSADHNGLPYNATAAIVLAQQPLIHLTTPIAYLSTLPHDIFYTKGTRDANDPPLPFYAYMDMVQLHELGLADEEEIWEERFFLVSRGPNGVFEANNIIDGELLSDKTIYDPRNGLVSSGDLFLSLQGMTGGGPLQNTEAEDGDDEGNEEND